MPTLKDGSPTWGYGSPFFAIIWVVLPSGDKFEWGLETDEISEFDQNTKYKLDQILLDELNSIDSLQWALDAGLFWQ